MRHESDARHGSPSLASTPQRPTLIRRALARRGVLELGMFAILAVAYNVVRALPRGDAQLAFIHAEAVLGAEGFLFEALELPLNQWMAGSAAVAVPACYFYALLHYVATPAVFLLSRRRGGRQYWRGYWALVIGSGIALIAYAYYPTAPPRLMPELGIVDVMRAFSDYGWWGSAASAPRGIGDATNQFAAMPSMHFGWALWCAVQMWGFGAAWRPAAVAYPALLTLVVLGTGNHFVLDLVAGGACIIGAYLAVEMVQRRCRPASPPADRSMLLRSARVD